VGFAGTGMGSAIFGRLSAHLQSEYIVIETSLWHTWIRVLLHCGAVLLAGLI